MTTAHFAHRNTPKREIGPATLQKLGEWAMTRNKSLFTASFDMA